MSFLVLLLSCIPWLYSWFYSLEVQSWFSLMVSLLGVPGLIPGQIPQKPQRWGIRRSTRARSGVHGCGGGGWAAGGKSAAKESSKMTSKSKLGRSMIWSWHVSVVCWRSVVCLDLVSDYFYWSRQILGRSWRCLAVLCIASIFVALGGRRKAPGKLDQTLAPKSIQNGGKSGQEDRQGVPANCQYLFLLKRKHTSTKKKHVVSMCGDFFKNRRVQRLDVYRCFMKTSDTHVV